MPGAVTASTIERWSLDRSRNTRWSPNWRLASTSATVLRRCLRSAMPELMSRVVVPTPPLAP